MICLTSIKLDFFRFNIISSHFILEPTILL
jgi:hypothetical protein